MSDQYVTLHKSPAVVFDPLDMLTPLAVVHSVASIPPPPPPAASIVILPAASVRVMFVPAVSCIVSTVASDPVKVISTLAPFAAEAKS